MKLPWYHWKLLGLPLAAACVIGAVLLLGDSESQITATRVGRAFGAAVVILACSFVVDLLYPKKPWIRLALWAAITLATLLAWRALKPNHEKTAPVGADHSEAAPNV